MFAAPADRRDAAVILQRVLNQPGDPQTSLPVYGRPPAAR